MPWCQTSICGEAARYVVAAREEVPAGCANCSPLSELPDRLRRVLGSGGNFLTPGARSLLALCPGGANVLSILRQLSEGRLVFLEPRTPRPLRSTALARRQPLAQPSEGPTPGQDDKPAWIEYQFVDAADQPVGGLVYELRLTTGAVERGALPADGRLRREPIPEGRCTAKIGLIEDARWSRASAGLNEPVRLIVRGDGFEPGTPVKCDVFPLYREQPEDLIASLSGALNDQGIASIEWQCPTVPVQSFGQVIFKAQIGSLRKASNVLSVERRIVSARWSVARVYDGESVSLEVETRGVADGAAVTLRIYEKDWLTSDDLVDDAGPRSAVVQNGRASVSWKAVWRPDDEKTGCENFIHYYFVAEIDGLIAHSPLLEVWPVLELTPEGAAAGAPYCVRLPDGTERHGVTGDGGRIRVPGARPGRAFASLGAPPGAVEAAPKEA